MRERLSPTSVILIALLAWQVCSQLSTTSSITCHSWGLTDWLVNYSGGFVRRGLAGTILLWVSELTNVSAHHLVSAISYLCYFCLMIWFLASITRHFSIAFIFSCVALGFPVYQSTILRKDCLLLLLMIACLACLRSKWTPWTKWIVVNLICSLGILLHETFAFFAIPGLIFLQTSSTWSEHGKRFIALVPSLTCFLLVTLHHGEPTTARAIHDSWMPLWQSASADLSLHAQPFATIQSIGWTTKEGMLQTKGILQTGLYQPLAWLTVCVLSFLFAGRFLRTDHDCNRTEDWLPILAFQFLCVSPLFLVGVDYGRWIFFWIASSMILFNSGYRIPIWLTNCPAYRRMAAPIGSAVGLVPKNEWLLLFFGLPVLWNIRNFLMASPIGRMIGGFQW